MLKSFAWSQQFARYSGMLLLAVLISQPIYAAPVGYTPINVKGRVSLEVPSDWGINDSEQRKKVADYAENLVGQGNVAAFSAKSFPAPSKVRVRVSILPMDEAITQEVVRKEIQNNRQAVIKDLTDAWDEEAPAMWAGLSKIGTKEVGQRRAAVESLGGKIALVTHYARTSTEQKDKTIRVSIYQVLLGSEKVMITFSVLDGDREAQDVYVKLKNSITIR